MDSDYEALQRIMRDPDLYNREKLRAIQEEGRKSGNILDGVCSRCRQPLIKVLDKNRVYHPAETYDQPCDISNDKSEVPEYVFFDKDLFNLLD